jgi:hypothetical protein
MPSRRVQSAGAACSGSAVSASNSFRLLANFGSSGESEPIDYRLAIAVIASISATVTVNHTVSQDADWLGVTGNK